MNLLIYVLFFLSGTAGLIYEVLWMKELGLLFGNTAYAAATTLTVFFLGLSVGGYVWGKISIRLKNPLQTYGFLEFCIAISACLFFLLVPAYRAVYSTLFAAFSNNPGMFVLVKLLLAGSILFLPAFFMGGTLPVMGQHLVRHPENLGKTGTLLYGLNTTGACLGTFLAGFILPIQLGFRLSYVTAIILSILIGISALLLSGMLREKISQSTSESSTDNEDKNKGPKFFLNIALISGFLTLGLEVLWIRMFSQVLQNSVYAFSMILIVFLLALAAGSFLANILTRTSIDPRTALISLLFLSFLGAVITPSLFYFITDGLQEIGHHGGWTGHIFSLFKAACMVIFVPGLFIGSVFPYLLKAVEGSNSEPGYIIGKLISINTIGSLAGSIFAGFILLNLFGLWTSIKIFSICYLLIAFYGVFTYRKLFRKSYISTVFIISILSLIFTIPSSPPKVSYDSNKEGLIEIIEGSHATVAVLRDDKNIRLKLNNNYQLGDLKGSRRQQVMAELPLLIHPDPGAVFFLGLGTGITAGASLGFPVDRVVVCELIPEVINASKKYFHEHVNNMYSDPRAMIIAEDGRNYLAGTKERYDVIIGDLFLPWKAGVGSLYTTEHFNSVKSRLNDSGIFVQWLPLWQHSWEEFSIIAKTMLQVFDQVTFWRLDFSNVRPIAGFIGHKTPRPLNISGLVENFRELTGDSTIPADMIKASMLSYYSGNLSQAGEIFKDAPINTDNMPLIEYLSPVSLYDHSAGHTRWLLGDNLYNFYERIIKSSPPGNDPYLDRLTDEDIRYIEAGLDMFGYNLYKDKNIEKSMMFKERMEKRLPASALQK